MLLVVPSSDEDERREPPATRPVVPPVKASDAFDTTSSVKDQDFELVPAAKMLPPDPIPLPRLEGGRAVHPIHHTVPIRAQLIEAMFVGDPGYAQPGFRCWACFLNC